MEEGKGGIDCGSCVSKASAVSGRVAVGVCVPLMREESMGSGCENESG